MGNDVVVKDGIIIPAHELEIITSRAGGPGGQHVNKADTRITVRWNVRDTRVLDEEQKVRVFNKLKNRLTVQGYLVVHNSGSRSQMQNKEQALLQLAEIVCHALRIHKKRIATRVPRSAQEKRLEKKARHSKIKKLRSRTLSDDY